MVFAHGSHQLGEITTMEFDIQLIVKKGKHPLPSPCLQKKAYPASPQKRQGIETNLQESLDLGVLEPVNETPRGAVISPVWKYAMSLISIIARGFSGMSNGFWCFLSSCIPCSLHS